MKTRLSKISVNVSIMILIFFAILAIFAPFLANDKAILCKDVDGLHFPVVSGQKCEQPEFSLQPFLKYHYSGIDPQNAAFISPLTDQHLQPGQQRHYLGTDRIGRDVAAGMIHASRVAILTGTGSMVIALLIGLLIGLTGAYFGNDQLSITRRSAMIGLLSIFLGTFLVYYRKYFSGNFSQVLFTLLIFMMGLVLADGVLKRLKPFRKRFKLPLDMMFSSFIEIFQSLPASFLVLVLVSLFTKASLYNVILIIGLLRWPSIARFARAEMLKIKEQRYIEAARAIGMSDLRIIVRHALPAVMTPVIVAVAFGFSSSILLESALSFLGIGLPADHVSFGSLLSEARKNYEAWWLVVFPGFAIFCLVFAMNTLGDHVSRLMERK
ncbi:MAG TPA: ABC transporter permease [Saprospiraceae bacterium]|nr:hypothetical protein [Saprospirales bacterium]HRQ30032.1 ABC transporter permease [Saprospiraceae bacterium]